MNDNVSPRGQPHTDPQQAGTHPAEPEVGTLVIHSYFITHPTGTLTYKVFIQYIYNFLFLVQFLHLHPSVPWNHEVHGSFSLLRDYVIIPLSPSLPLSSAVHIPLEENIPEVRAHS